MAISKLFRSVNTALRQRAKLDPVHGVSLCHDLKRLIPHFDPQVIFDVGANQGQSIPEFGGNFPRARIICFEPIRATFGRLQKNTSGLPNVDCYNLGLGSEPRSALMIAAKKSELSSLADAINDTRRENGVIEAVQIDALDEFCLAHGLTHIDILKIDTEGHDMEVLRGGESLLDNKCIDVIQVEAGMSSLNSTHVPFDDFRAHLESKKYHLFGLYDQVHEWPTDRPSLRRANAVFISEFLVNGRD